MSFPRPLAWALGGAIRRHQRRFPGAPVDLWWLPTLVRLFVRGLSEYDVDFTRACIDGRMYDVDHGEMLAAVQAPTLLIAARSFVHPTLGLVGAMADEDIDAAVCAQPSVIVERTKAQHVVHIDNPRQYVAYVDRIARLAQPNHVAA